MTSAQIVTIYRALSKSLKDAQFEPPVTHVYNPLDYARIPAEQYLALARPGLEVLFLGMNPGPWGMAQTGVPFGTVPLVRDWLSVEGAVAKPAVEHPRRPVEGFATRREEVSGTRFWGWARDRYETPDRFFRRFFVANYCPLVFMEASGRNRTPDKLPVEERKPLFRHCDRALQEVVELLRPQWVIGVGKFAEDRARSALSDHGVNFGRILHPSPASPAANRGWLEQAERQLAEMGIR
jgi:single-strand selective monofunctional uracil DNA glycosylase